MVRLRLIISCCLIACGLAPPAAGQPILVDNQPYNFGGLASDTLLTLSGQSIYQRVADDFMLTNPAMVGSLVVWGFYNADNPPMTETMRVRFMEAHPDDGLPDESNVVYGESFFNPSRVATGRTVLTGIGPREYRYQMDLTIPVPLIGGRPYWLEFVQIGDSTTRFRWESSDTELNGQAFINPITGDWRTTIPGGVVSTAYQLIAIPEPASLGMLGMGLVSIVGQRKRALSRRQD